MEATGKRIPSGHSHNKMAKFRRWLPLYLMFLPGAIYLIINNYIPMAGIVVAFKTYKAKLGLFASPWAGLKNFEFLFAYANVLNPDHRFKQVRDNARRPAVAKAVSKTKVTKSPFIAVDIHLTFLAHLIDTAAIFQPFDIKIFPERSRADGEHTAVIFLHHGKRPFIFTISRHTR